jgi:HEAT repeat protein
VRTRLALLLVAGMASAARAEGKAAIDVDGDGVADEVALEANGSLTVTSGKTKKVIGFKALAGSGIGRGRLQVRRYEKRVVLAAVGDREAAALEWKAGRLVDVWQGSVGPEGPDGESTLYVEVGPYGLVRYHARAGVTRCDGKTAYLYPEVYDFKTRRFWPATSSVPRMPDGAPVLKASRTPPPGAKPNASALDFRVLGASSQLGAGGAGDLVAPTEVEDGKADTAWVEGLRGPGKGEFLTARASLSDGKVRAIRLVPGHPGSAKMFADFNRPKRIGILVGKERAFVAELEDPVKAGGAPGDPYWIVLPEPVVSDCVSVVLIDSYAGRIGSGNTAIAELAVLTEMDLTGGGVEGLAARVAAGGRAGEQAAGLLARVGAPAEQALLAEAQKPGASAEALVRIRRVLAEIPAGAGELARGLAAPGAHPADVTDFTRALAAIGRPAVDPLVEVMNDRRALEEGRARAAQALGGIGDAAAEKALIAAAGSGPRPVRRAIALSLGERPASSVDAVLEAATLAQGESPAREADLWIAVGRLGGRNAPEQSYETAMKIVARLGSARGYELRARLIEALAACRMRNDFVVKALAAELASPMPVTPERSGRRDEAERVALRRIAAAALGRVAGPPAREALAAATADPDPGVREAAADAIAAQPSNIAQAAVDPALARVLAHDDWARVRRAAANALGTRCRDAAPAASLRGAIRADPDVEVRRSALSALATCRARGVVALFLELAAERGQPVGVRSHAAHLLGGLGDHSATARMAAMLGRERERAFSDAGAIQVAAALAYALGALGDPAGGPALMAAAEESSAFPEIQAAAATGLGALCPPGAGALLRKLAGSAQHQVSTAARAAARRCRAR